MVTPLTVPGTTTGFRPIDVLQIAIIVVLLFAAAILALAETSLVRTSRIKAKALADEGRRGSKPLLKLVEHPENFLNPVLLLVLVCQLVTATLVGLLAADWFGAIGVIVAIVFEVVVIFVLAEAVPKNWAVQHPERAALFSAPLVSAVVRFPPIKAVSSVLIGTADFLIGRRRGSDKESRANVTESELLAMADVAMAEDVIETEERAFIHSIIEFGDTVVREVMVPRPDMVAVEDSKTVTATLEAALGAGYSRLPVYHDTIDDVTGIAYTKDLFGVERQGRGGEPVSGHVRSPSFVPETKRVSDLLREMQEKKFHMCIVVDEYGGTAGLVTLEDLIEELVGEIVDEYDVEDPSVQRLNDGSVLVSGRVGIGEAEEIVGSELPQGTWDTLGGLVLDRAGRVPKEGESVQVDGFTFVVQRVQGRRIGQIRIVPSSPEARLVAGDAER